MDDNAIVRIAANPIETARQRSFVRGRKLGVAFSSYFPLEIFSALGLEGVWLPTSPRSQYPFADSMIQGFACTYMRSSAEVLLNDELPVGLVGGVSSCDAQLALPSVLTSGGIKAPVANIKLPISVVTPAARKHARNALAEFCDVVTSALGRSLDKVELVEAVKSYEAVRMRVDEIFDMMVQGGIYAHTAYSAAIASHVMHPDDFLDATANLAGSGTPARGVPVILSAAVLPSAQLVADIEDLGARIVADDTNTGRRASGRRVNGPVTLDAIADSLIDRPLHGPERFVGSKRPPQVAQIAASAGAKGAILVRNKFCDPTAFETPELIAELKARDIPAVVIELDREAGLASRDRTLVQTLLERLS